MVQLYKRKGGEVLVNTQTTGSQLAANIALLTGGGYVVTWSDNSEIGGDTWGSGIKAQRYDADGNKLGGEFLVNTVTDGGQTASAVTGLASGRFVITWADGSASGGDTSSSAVRGQLFEADGTRVGTEFLVNTATAGSQSAPSITEVSGGGFVVSWTDASGVGGDNSGTGIKAQIFNANGAKVGAEILVNTVIAGSQGQSSVIALGTGFAVAWRGASTNVNSVFTGSVRVQLFDSSGAKIGGEQVVNASNEGIFDTVAITALASGFIVTWSQTNPPVEGVREYSAHGQLFDASGVKVGGDFVVNATTAASYSADVDRLPGGGFIVTWQGPGEGIAGAYIYGQIFDNAGARVGSEFVIASAPNQPGAKVDVLPSGEIVVLWTDAAAPGDSSGTGIVMQILTPTTDGPTDIALSGSAISETAREGEGLLTLSTTGAVNGSFTYQIVSDSTGGAFGIVGDRLAVVDNSLLDFETNQQVEVRIRTTDVNGNSYEETLLIDVTDTPENGYAPASGEFLLNTTVTGDQGDPTLAALPNGGYLATWEQWPPSGSGPVEVRGQFFDAAGAKVGTEFALVGDSRALAVLPDGGFVTARTGSDSNGYEIFVTFYDAVGTARSGPIPVNANTLGSDSRPAIAVLSNGNLIVTWVDSLSPSLPHAIIAQILDPAGNRIGDELTIPSATVTTVNEVTVLDNGNFVISWPGGSAVAQIFTQDGARVGSLLTQSEVNIADPHVTALKGGGFVITGPHNVSGMYRLSAEIFDSEGRMIGSPILISENSFPAAGSVISSVSALPWGGFAIAWTESPDPGEASGDNGIRAQVFDATGAPIGAQIFVNVTTHGGQTEPSIAVLGSGDVVIAWTDSSHTGADTSGEAVRARIFSLAESHIPTSGPDTLTGTPDDDTINGFGGSDVINGLGGNDVLIGGTGADQMTGGTGNDWYFVDNAGDTVTEATDEGTDRVFASVSYTLGAGQSVELLTTDYSPGTAAINLTGNELANALIGNDGANILDGGAGADTLIGLGGDDYYFVDSAGDVVIESAGQGNDRVFASVSYALSAGQSVELLTTDFSAGTAAINLSGNELANTIFGNDGSNILDGKAGADTLVGRLGDDYYLVDNAGDVVVESAGQGNDRIFASASYALAAGVSVELLTTDFNPGTSAINLTGNELANVIIGNDGANILDGKAGADTLIGFGGDDFYYVDSAGDTVVENAGQGNDRILTSVSYALAAGASVELLTTDFNPGTAAINLTGNEIANVILGNDGVNILDGRAGADTLAGFGGDDFYYVDNAGDVVLENAGQGNDRIFASTSYTLAAGASVEVLTTDFNPGTTAINFTGNEIANVILGNDGANILDGKAGADTLAGFGGADIFAFTTAIGGGNVDRLLDFQSGVDKIALDDAIFTAIGPTGALDPNAFVTGTAAADASDRIVYDSTTGQLFYDADGSGAAAAVLIATLDGKPALAAGDFQVI